MNRQPAVPAAIPLEAVQVYEGALLAGASALRARARSLTERHEPVAATLAANAARELIELRGLVILPAADDEGEDVTDTSTDTTTNTTEDQPCA